MLSVGKALKAHGVRGEIKAECYTDAPSFLVRVKKLFVDGKEYSVEKIRAQGEFLLIKLEGVEDMNAAEWFRGKVFFARKNDLPSLPEGRYFIQDLIGSAVYLGEEKLGKLNDILQYGSADVYVVQTANGQEVLFPYVGSVVQKVDIDKKEIVLSEDEFKKVAVYED